MKNKNRENDGLGMWKIRIKRMMDWVCEKEWVGEKEWITWVGLDIGKSEFQEVSNYLKCWLYLKNAINDFFFFMWERVGRWEGVDHVGGFGYWEKWISRSF